MAKCSDCPGIARTNRRHCEVCAEKARARANRYRKENPELVKEQKRREYILHRDKYIARAMSWGESNPDRRVQIRRQWARDNPDKVRDSRVASKANARAASLGAEGILTQSSRGTVITTWGDSCLSCGSKENITMDHVVPLALGGANDESNLQPLCIDCNRKKHLQSTDYRAT